MLGLAQMLGSVGMQALFSSLEWVGQQSWYPQRVPRVSHPPCLSFAHANLLFCAYVNLVSSARNHSG